jgi:SAM-dependent methyltransferase
VGPTGTVVLSDIAPRMVDVARARNAGLANVQVALLDLAAIDRPDDGFDVAACRMGLMFLPDPVVGLTEIRRVLRPGGRLGVLTWAGIEHNPWMTCVGLAAMAHGVVTGGPPVGPGEVFSLGDPAALADAGRQAGFLDVDVDELGMTFRSPSVEEHVERVSGLAAPLAAAFAAATADQLAGVRRTAAELASPYATDGGVAIPGRALLLTARA